MAAKKTTLPPSVAQSTELTQRIQNDLAQLLQQYKLREDAHAANVAELEMTRESTLLTAKNSANETIAAAKLQADKILCDAKTDASKIVNDAEKQLSEITKEKQAWEEEKKRMSSIQPFQQQINLDVGGTKLATSIVTLRRFPDTMIGVMFSGRHELPLNHEGYHFIDRDGTHFRHILNFLRNPEGYKVSLSPEHEQELKEEAEYYGIKELMFPFTPANPETVAPDFDYSGYYKNITITQDKDGMWYMKYKANSNSDKYAVTCCHECKGGYVNVSGCAVGLCNFSTNRTIVNKDQPKPTSRCAICGR